MEVTKNKEQAAQGQEGKKPESDPAIIEELMKGYQRPEDLTGPGGIIEHTRARIGKQKTFRVDCHFLRLLFRLVASRAPGPGLELLALLSSLGTPSSTIVSIVLLSKCLHLPGTTPANGRVWMV